MQPSTIRFIGEKKKWRKHIQWPPSLPSTPLLPQTHTRTYHKIPHTQTGTYHTILIHVIVRCWPSRKVLSHGQMNTTQEQTTVWSRQNSATKSLQRISPFSSLIVISAQAHCRTWAVLNTESFIILEWNMPSSEKVNVLGFKVVNYVIFDLDPTASFSHPQLSHFWTHEDNYDVGCPRHRRFITVGLYIRVSAECARTHTHTHTNKHARTLCLTHTRIHKHTRGRARTHTYTNTHTHTHKHIYTRIHLHTH